MFTVKPWLAVIALVSVTSVASAARWTALPETAPAPANNPTTEAKIELGKMLFHDPRLSSTGTVSCSSCHSTLLGGDDNRKFSMGVHGQTGGRSAPTVWNAAFNEVQFWDGRAASLEAQAAGPVTNSIEMGMKSWKQVVARLKTIPGYQSAFEAAFGADSISKDNATKAIAAFERTLITPNSAYDKYVKGDKTAMTEQQIRGMNTFSETGCTSCHAAPLFSTTGVFMKFPTFKNNALRARYHFDKDKGRAEVTKNSEDNSLWKVPTLRNIALTAPYFHNGAVGTLEGAVKVMAKLQLNKNLSKEETADIVAFLNALTGEFPEHRNPHRLPTTPNTRIVTK